MKRSCGYGGKGEARRARPAGSCRGERRAAARGPAGGQASAPLTENGRRVEEAQSRPGTAAEEGAALWASPALRGQAEQTEW